MRINEYKRTLKELTEDELDKLTIQHLGHILIAVPPENPPPKWTNFQGALLPSSSSTERASQDSSTTIQTSSGETLQANALLTGLMSDLTAAFGQTIAHECLDPALLGSGTPLSAREVSAIIDHAEAMQADLRQQNDRAISLFFRDMKWVNHTRNISSTDTEAFVKKLAAAQLRSSPEYARGPLSQEDITNAANEGLATYNSLISEFGGETGKILKIALSLIAVLPENAATEAFATYWPEYVTAAALSLNVNATQNSTLQQILRISDPDNACSRRFLNNIRTFIAELFIRQAKESPDYYGGLRNHRDNRSRFPEVKKAGTVLLKDIITQHVKRLSLIESDSSKTSWEKIFIRMLIDDTPPDDKRLKEIIKFGMSTEHFSISQRNYSAAASGILTHVTGEAARLAKPGDVDSPFEGERLLGTLMALVAAKITPSEACLFLEALENGAGKEALAMRGDAKDSAIIQAYETLLAALRERSGEAGPSFQTSFVKWLKRGKLSSDELPKSISSGDLLDACLALSRNGKKIIDESFLDSLDADTQDGYLVASLLDILMPRSEPRKHKVDISEEEFEQLATLITALSDVKEAFSSACETSIFQPSIEDEITMTGKSEEALFVPNGPAIMRVSPPGNNDITFTLLDTSAGQILMTCQYIVPSLESVFDGGDNPHRLNSELSQICFSTDITILSDQAVIEMTKPVRCDATLVFPKWPLDKHYPAPIGADLCTGSPYCQAARKDMTAYSVAYAKPEITTALDALNAIGTFRNSPSRLAALSIYAKFLKSNSLTFIGDNAALGSTLDSLYLVLSVDAIVSPLKEFILALPEKLHQPLTDTPPTIRAFLALADRITNAGKYEELPDLFELLKTLRDNKDPERILDLVPREFDAQLSDMQDRLAEKLEVTLFNTMEKAICGYFDKKIMPDFHVYEYAQAEKKNANQ